MSGAGTGSMSKTWSLAGLAAGVDSGPVELIRAVCIHRDYNTISVGMIDDYLASLRSRPRTRSGAHHAITRTNLAVLDNWISKEPLVSYIKPRLRQLSRQG